MTVLEQTRDGRGVVTLTLNRPQIGNRLSGELIAALTGAAETLAQDCTVRVIVLTGAGRRFAPVAIRTGCRRRSTAMRCRGVRRLMGWRRCCRP